MRWVTSRRTGMLTNIILAIVVVLLQVLAVVGTGGFTGCPAALRVRR